MSDDTDTLIAIVTSLLDSPVIDATIILDALVQSDGDPAKAAGLLNASTKPKKTTSKPLSTTSKRKRPGDLDSWFKAPSKSKAKLDDASTSASSSSTSIVTERDVPEVERRGPLDSPGRPQAPQAGSSKPLSSAAKPKSKSSKAAVDLMSVLRHAPPSPKKQGPPRLPPLTLANPEMVQAHTPCTLHYSVLPQELACKLFHAMVEEAKAWKRNKWWLFERLVESPHRTCFWVRGNEEERIEMASGWYNGRSVNDAPKAFPREMEEACDIIEEVVNAELKKRPRMPLEWAGGDGRWRANVAASNQYEGAKESVGYHSDQMTHLGPCCTIASLSLGTRRVFSLREVIPTDQREKRAARTFNIPLPHNSLTIMHASCQERFKHSIPPMPSIDLFRPQFPPDSPPSNSRINITFRFYRPDFRPNTTPKCKCDQPAPTVLRADTKGPRIDATVGGGKGKDGVGQRYWWSCFSGAQNEGKDCGYWKVLDMEKEGRGPCVGDVDVGSRKKQAEHTT